MSSGTTQPAESDPRPGQLSWLTDWVSEWGAVVIDAVSLVGDLSLFIWQTLTWLVSRWPRRETLLPSLY